MPSFPAYTPPEENRQLSAGMVADLQRNVQSLYATDAPDGFVIDSSPAGNRFRDERFKPFPARILGDTSSSSSDNSSSSDAFDRYSWKEVLLLTDGTFIDKVNGRSGTLEHRYAKEANGDASVPEDVIVELHPGPGSPDFYYFWYSASASSDALFTFDVSCDEGTIIVGNPTNPGTSSSGKISSSGGGTGVTPKDGGGGDGPGTVPSTGTGGGTGL